MFGRIMVFDSLPGANEYILTVRCVFREDTILRRSGNAAPEVIDPSQSQLIRASFHRYMDSYRRAQGQNPLFPRPPQNLRKCSKCGLFHTARIVTMLPSLI